MLAQTYVVRIYRRGGASREFIGIVEIVGSRRRLRFDSFDTLRAILAKRPPGSKGRSTSR